MAVRWEELLSTGPLEIREGVEVRTREFVFHSDAPGQDGMATEADLATSIQTQFGDFEGFPLWIGSEWGALAQSLPMPQGNTAKPIAQWPQEASGLICRDVRIRKAGASPVRNPLIINAISSFYVTFIFTTDPTGWKTKRTILTREAPVPVVVDLDHCQQDPNPEGCLADRFERAFISDQSGRRALTYYGALQPNTPEHLRKNYELIDCGNGTNRFYSQFVLEMERLNWLPTFTEAWDIRNFMKSTNKVAISIQANDPTTGALPFLMFENEWMLDEVEFIPVRDFVFMVRARFVYDEFWHRYMTVKLDCETEKPDTRNIREFDEDIPPTPGGGPAPNIQGDGTDDPSDNPNMWALVSHRIYPSKDWSWFIDQYLP